MDIYRDSAEPGAACPFSFNFDPSTFRCGEMVSYRVPERFGDMPFAGTLTEVHADHVVIAAMDDPSRRMRGTRESRPAVGAADALG